MSLMLQRLIEEARSYFAQQGHDEDIAEHCFELQPFSGQGATSRHYILTVRRSTEPPVLFFVKRYGNADGQASFWREQLVGDFAMTGAIASGLSDLDSPYIQVLKPLFVVEDELLLVLPFIRGLTFAEQLYQNLKLSRLFKSGEIGALCNDCAQIGRGLRQMQQVPVEIVDSAATKSFNPATYQNIIDRCASILAKYGLDQGVIEASLDVFGRALAEFNAPNELCFEHSDFIPQNLLMDAQGSLFLYDFPNACIGLGYVDIAHFLSSLNDYTYLKTVSHDCVRTLSRHFWAGYCENSDIDWNLLSAFMIYIQFYSTSISIVEHSDFSLLKKMLFTDPESKFRENIELYMDSGSLEKYLTG